MDVEFTEQHPILSFFMGFTFPPLLAAFLIGLPSCVLYTSQVILLLANWGEFNSSFLKLFIVRAIPSIWNMFNSYFSFRFQMLFPALVLPFYLAMPRVVLRTFFFTNHYTYHVENLCTMFLILHRLTSILAPFRHDKIWRVGVPLTIAVILLLPLPFTITVYSEVKADIYFFDKSNASFGFLSTVDEFPYSRIASVSAVIFILVCTVLNVATIYLYRKYVVKSGGTPQDNQKTTNEQRIESKLTIYAFITFFCQLSMGLCFLSMFVCLRIDTPLSHAYGIAIFNFFGLIYDVCTVAVPAWSMLWACEKMRLLFTQKCQIAKQLFMRKILRRNVVVDVPIIMQTVATIRKSSIRDFNNNNNRPRSLT